IHRRLRAGKTVQTRRRRATVRRKLFRASHCPEILGGKAARISAAEPGDRRSPQPRKPETIPDTRTTFSSRARRERRLLMRISVRVLSYLCSAVFLIFTSVVSPPFARAQATATLAGTITDLRDAVISGAQISV